MADRKRIAFTSQTPFFRELKHRVDAHFTNGHISSHANGAAYLKTGIIMLWWAASFGLFLWRGSSVPVVLACAVATGLSVTGLGCCVMHDGGHGSVSSTKWVNGFMARVLDFIGGSSFVWRHKHNVLHHTYTNVAGLDDDIIFLPYLRLTPNQPRYVFHRWQHLYIWPLYSLLVIKWHWWDDFQDVILGRIGGQKIPRPRGSDIVTLLVGKAAVATWAVVLPVVFHGWALGLLYYVVTQMVAGLTLAIAFQLAHCVENVAWPTLPAAGTPVQRLPWSEHQLATTVDFARSNPLVTWYLGGLNYQAVHHLFPGICHVHYPALSLIVEETCREYGVPYLVQSTFRGALASHYRWLRTMGQPLAA